MYQSLQSQSEILLRQDAFQILSLSIQENFSTMIGVLIWPEKILLITYCLLVTGPIIAIYLYFTTVILRAKKSWWLLNLLVILGGISPLTLHFLGWDFQRWFMLAGTTSFLMFSLVYLEYQENYISLSSGLNGFPAKCLNFIFSLISRIPLGQVLNKKLVDLSKSSLERKTIVFLLAIVCVNLVMYIPFFEGYKIQYFPFISHIRFWVDVIWGHIDFFIPPDTQV